jgi:phosphomannomutase
MPNRLPNIRVASFERNLRTGESNRKNAIFMKVATIFAPSPILFGTDGWRAVIGEEFTFSNLERVTQAFADYTKNIERSDWLIQESNDSTKKIPLIIIGYDRRFLSEKFARRVAEVLAGNNLETALFDEAVPTPLVSWAVREKGASYGIVITASHNPAEFNGFKIKAPWGGSASPEITKAVEASLDLNPPQLATFSQHNKSEILKSAIESYRKQISTYIDLERIRAMKTQIIIDPMHGVGGLWVESFLKAGNLKTETIRAVRDPLFGGVHPEPIDANLSALKNRVLETRAVLGLATDGDADRLGAVNEMGQTMTMHEVVPLLLLHLIRNRKMSGGVVRTFSQSVLTKRIAEAYNLPLFETPIGFKYIADLMLNEDILIGAEESGGIGVKGHLPERDGILNSLLLLEAVITAGKPPSEIVRDIHREFGEFHFDRKDLKMEVDCGKDFVSQLALNPPSKIEGGRVVGIETDDGTKLLFHDESWLLFRQSGTEPLLRIYSEATSFSKTKALLEAGQSIALKNINAGERYLML